MTSKIEVRSTAHRKVPVVDILPNPHRDLNANPVVPEKIDGLIESFDRTGFWDNIVVREHPTKEGKYQLAYGHNRLAALKDKRVEVDTITIPVAKLTDWEMYCCMVDENELSGRLTTTVIMENVSVGCDLIEGALKKAGKTGTWEEFNNTMGRSVPLGTERGGNDHGFEKVRTAFFEGEGIGRGFLAEFLPCGKIRSSTISEIVNSRYGESRRQAKEQQAKQAADDAKKAEKQANTETDTNKKEKLTAKAKAKAEEAAKLKKEAERIGKGSIKKEVLLLFDVARNMTDFAEAVRKIGVPPTYHERAARFILKANVSKDRIKRELDVWWYKESGAERAAMLADRRKTEREKFLKSTRGRDYISVLLGLAEHLRNDEKDWRAAVAATHLLTPKERNIIENKIVPIADLINALIKQSRAHVDEGEATVVPSIKMLEHQKG